MKVSKDNLTNRLHEADAQYYIAKLLYYETDPSRYYEIYKDESEVLFYEDIICFYEDIICLLDEAINLVPELFGPMPGCFYHTMFPILEFQEEVWHRYLIESKDTDKQQYVYNIYRESNAWKRKRKRRRIIDKYTCVCGGPAEHVHHKTYDNIGKEAMDDLVSMCQSCHNMEHST